MHIEREPFCTSTLRYIDAGALPTEGTGGGHGHTALTNGRVKPGKGYDPARAIARWETEGGASQGGSPWIWQSIGSKPVGTRVYEYRLPKMEKTKRLKKLL